MNHWNGITKLASKRGRYGASKLKAFSVLARLPGGPLAGDLKGILGGAVGAAGAKNAAYFAAEILSLKYNEIRNAYEKYRSELQGANQ